ncbi:MAG: phosphoribosylformylglycinamidine synthase subunit PurQ [Vampirovibrionales bacterium]
MNRTHQASDTRLRVGVVIFPGSNCDADAVDAIEQSLHATAVHLWHDTPADTLHPDTLDALFIPGGFSYGDYLRCGAMAKQSPIMPFVKAFATLGKPILGVCNGFQILTEAGLLPGALVRNHHQRFICEQRTPLMVSNTHTCFTTAYTQAQRIELPIAHGEGCYVADADTLARLEANNQVVFRYLRNPNGSMNDIAGIINEQGNVLGLIPHPERNLHALATSLFSGEGHGVFASLRQHLVQRTPTLQPV